MYKLEFLPAARLDMIDIVRYISRDLGNPTAAERIAAALIRAAESIPDFPYANPGYYPIRPLKHEYRKLSVENYLIFYWVDEAQKTVTVARVVYARRDYGVILE